MLYEAFTVVSHENSPTMFLDDKAISKPLFLILPAFIFGTFTSEYPVEIGTDMSTSISFVFFTYPSMLRFTLSFNIVKSAPTLYCSTSSQRTSGFGITDGTTAFT